MTGESLAKAKRQVKGKYRSKLFYHNLISRDYKIITNNYFQILVQYANFGFIIFKSQIRGISVGAIRTLMIYSESY